MRQASKRIPESAEKTVRDIRRATRRHHSAEEKIRIVLEGRRGEDSIAELCRKEGINQNLYYRWSKEFLEAGKKRLAGDTASQGNALKTILAMGYVLDREREDVNSINNDAVEVTFIESRGVKHRIEFRADHVTNQPKITHKSKRTRFAVHRPGEPAPGYARRRLSPATRPQRLLV